MEGTRRRSLKREAILRAIRSTDCHPSAEWVYAQVKPQHPDLSLGTVYRNLALFRAEGQIMSVGTVDGQERFDGDTHPHGHFVCEKCGAVLDIELDSGAGELYDRLQEQYGAVVRTHALTFFGVCGACAGEKGA